MRKVNTADVFKMARIIKGSGLSNKLKDLLYEGTKEGVNQEALGIEAIMTVMEGCTDVEMEKRIYELLGGILEKTNNDIAEQSLEKTIEDIKAIANENNLLNFFKQANQLSR